MERERETEREREREGGREGGSLSLGQGCKPRPLLLPVFGVAH